MLTNKQKNNCIDYQENILQLITFIAYVSNQAYLTYQNGFINFYFLRKYTSPHMVSNMTWVYKYTTWKFQISINKLEIYHLRISFL